MGANYDGVLKMYVEQVREPDMAKLTFLRWLYERGRLEPNTDDASIAGEGGELSKGSSRFGGGSEANRVRPPWTGYFPVTAEGKPRLNIPEMGSIARERGI